VFLDIIHRPVFIQNIVSEIGLCLRLQVVLQPTSSCEEFHIFSYPDEAVKDKRLENDLKESIESHLKSP
jgi:hypothetical protein